jgi:hypothetical protein
MFTAEALVIAVFVMSNPAVVTRPAPWTVLLPVMVVPETAPVEATDPTAAAPVIERLSPCSSPGLKGLGNVATDKDPPVIAPVTATSDPDRLPETVNEPPEMSPVASIVEAFSRGFPAKSTPPGFNTG